MPQSALNSTGVSISLKIWLGSFMDLVIFFLFDMFIKVMKDDKHVYHPRKFFMLLYGPSLFDPSPDSPQPIVGSFACFRISCKWNQTICTLAGFFHTAYGDLMEPLLYMWFAIDQNVAMQQVTILRFVHAVVSRVHSSLLLSKTPLTNTPPFIYSSALQRHLFPVWGYYK
jgi:hypothetical protein